MKDEYIRKQDAVDAICCNITITGRQNAEIVTSTIGAFADRIKAIQPVDVAPVVHAYWRDTGSGQECSACKEIQYGYDTGRYFCANCGADMRGEEDG